MDWGTIATIAVTGLVTICAASIGPVVSALAEKQRRKIERKETLADLCADLLQRCNAYRDAKTDVTFLDGLTVVPGLGVRTPAMRVRDEAGVMMDAALVRVVARSRRLAPLARKLVDAARREEWWAKAQTAFVEALRETAERD